MRDSVSLLNFCRDFEKLCKDDLQKWVEENANNFDKRNKEKIEDLINNAVIKLEEKKIEFCNPVLVNKNINERKDQKHKLVKASKQKWKKEYENKESIFSRKGKTDEDSNINENCEEKNDFYEIPSYIFIKISLILSSKKEKEDGKITKNELKEEIIIDNKTIEKINYISIWEFFSAKSTENSDVNTEGEEAEKANSEISTESNKKADLNQNEYESLFSTIFPCVNSELFSSLGVRNKFLLYTETEVKKKQDFLTGEKKRKREEIADLNILATFSGMKSLVNTNKEEKYHDVNSAEVKNLQEKIYPFNEINNKILFFDFLLALPLLEICASLVERYSNPIINKNSDYHEMESCPQVHAYKLFIQNTLSLNCRNNLLEQILYDECWEASEGDSGSESDETVQQKLNEILQKNRKKIFVKKENTMKKLQENPKKQRI